MKYLFIAFTALLFSLNSYAQSSCCTLNTGNANAMLAMNEDFAKQHAEPLAFKLEKPLGELIEMPAKDGKNAKAYFIRSKKKSNKYIFVFHEWWGLNDHIKRESEHLYNSFKNVNVIAIDLYDGGVAATREEAQKLAGGLEDARARAIIKAAFDYAGTNAEVATYGFCMGGAWSLQAALIGGNNVDACVMYYGMPEMDVEKLKTLQTDVLGIFAEKDNHINVETVKNFEAKMKEAGKDIVVYNYVAEHAFANPSNPQYNAEATKDAFIKASAYLSKR
ncbi:MAG: dienelactone hydrolase family protein, partial [Bacteroidota bacterium]